MNAHPWARLIPELPTLPPEGSSLLLEIRGALVIVSIFLALLGLAELWRRVGGAPAEWTRKLVHLGGGLVCLLFPFMLESLWTVTLMAALMTALFVAGSRYGFLPSLHAISRKSRGAEYFPLAIVLLLLFTGEQTWLYVAAILVLAVADASAALVGRRYGTIRYQVNQSEKTLEGSLVFFLVAFQAVLLPTLLMTDLPRLVCVLAAVLVAVLVTFFEAISLRGSDNLFVPLGTAVILESITRQPLGEIAYQNLSLLSICVGAALLTWRLPFFNPGSIMALVLYAYGAWSFGSWHWALPIFIGMLAYLLVWAGVDEEKKAPPIRVLTTVRALLAPFLFVALAGGTGERELFLLPYLGASACVLALALADPLHRLTSFGHQRLLTPLTAAATLLVVLPARLAQPDIVPLSALWLVPLAIGPITWLVLRHELKEDGAPLSEWSAPRFLASWAAAAVVVAAAG